MRSDDYRQTDYAQSYDITNRKEALKAQIRKKHPKSSSDYTLLGCEIGYLKDLASVYNRRCAYCGLPIEVVSDTGFEMDHIICKDACTNGGAVVEQGGHSVDNLAYACHNCNSKKRAFVMIGKLWEMLSPDRGLGATFTRKEDYSIVLSNKAIGDPGIELFYSKMRFASQLRRVDYLLAEMMDFKRHLEKRQHQDGKIQRIVEILAKAILSVMEKRNTLSRKMLEQS